ncbi:AIPR family protein [Mesoplasma lactucae]|uniref:Abortive phage infection protein C-terminal domain-containing protein n=1 Tax=Mesoplasma lactucae ATCC 49193 TaxID=81460 RepID=A0A291IS85_9MOLU|nr:AIPR family protein [Mesoplasma lactucae]ATG97805.1 hypothetical protein CP520_03655 [Mesoplasma lactucae ATCC 49193]ATZ20417.1 hypothetical protein MLACT_v1c05960 [Mesoplasma lactucae ATCC 49193]MCL8216588.1 hypothetical protein [Mesoplasma lactucae ATCC 49193]
MEIYLDNLLNEEIEFLDKELDINKKKDFFDCLEARKMIFNNLYSDDSLIGFELSSYIKKTFTKNGNYLNYFDLVTLDRDNETAHLIIFCNSEDDLNLKNLGWKIQNANDLINNSLSKKDEYTGNQKIARVAEDNVELANILQEIKRFEDIKIDIVLFDFAKKNNSNKIESFIEKESNNCSTDLNLLTNKSYKVKMSDSFLNEGKQNKKMTLSYLDDNKNAQEDYAINGNFIKNGNNYVFSIQAYSLYKAYKEYGEELFDRNVRYFIKSTTGISGQVNKSILNTLENEPQDFWTLNNGIVIIGDVAEDGINQINKTITFNNLDIVNGAQTVTNIYEFAKKKVKRKQTNLNPFI